MNALASGIWISIIEHDSKDRIRSHGPIIPETYTRDTSSTKVAERMFICGDGLQCWAGLVSFVVPQLDFLQAIDSEIKNPTDAELMDWGRQNWEFARRALLDAYACHQAGGRHV